MGDLFFDKGPPTSLEKVVTLRIERLGDDSRRILQQAAVIGLNFEYKLLKELVAPVNTRFLDESIKELERYDFIFEKSKFPQKFYSFRNEAIHRIVYDQIPPNKKIKTHSDIAKQLEKLHKSNIEDNYVLIASHYLKSDDQENGVEFSLSAAKHLMKSYKLRDALDFFIKAYNLLNELYSTEKVINLKKFILKKKCEIYLLLGNYDLASNSLHFYKTLLSDADYYEAIDAKRMAAEIYVEKGEFRRAFEIMEETRKLCKDGNSDHRLVSVLRVLAFIHTFTENFEESLKICEEGLLLCTDGDTQEKGQFIIYQGFAEFYRNNYTAARGYFKKAMTIFENIHDKAQIGKTYCNIGMISFKEGNYKEALDNYRQSLEILKDIEYRRAIAITMMNMAVLYDHMSDYKLALEQYQTVLKEAEETGNSRLLMMVLCNMGDVLARLGQDKTALRCLKESYEHANKIGSIFWKTSSLLHIGAINLKLGNKNSAVEFLEESISLSIKLGDAGREMEGRLLLLESEISSRNILEEALILLEKSDNNIELHNYEGIKSKVVLLASRAHALYGDLNVSRTLLEKGLAYALKKHQNEYAFRFYLYLAKLHLLNKNRRKARLLTKDGLELLREIELKIPDQYLKTFKKDPLVSEFHLLLDSSDLKDNHAKNGDFYEIN
jgi:tetratricopeptide (TPR) repeat protein